MEPRHLTGRGLRSVFPGLYGFFSAFKKNILENIEFFNIFKVNFKHADLKFWISDQALLNLEVTLKVPFFFANVTWAEMRFEICCTYNAVMGHAGENLYSKARTRVFPCLGFLKRVQK